MWYSTVIRVNGQARPIMAKTYDGRPIKLDGNPDHPLVRGRSDARTQAALLDLYDPDRGGIDPAQPSVFHDGPKRRDGSAFVATTWADLDTAVGTALKSGSVLLITGPVDGPARLAHLDVLRRSFGDRLRHVAYHPWAQDSAVTARERILGERSAPRWQLANARVLVAFGSDLLADADTATPGRLRHLPPRHRRRTWSADLRRADPQPARFVRRCAHPRRHGPPGVDRLGGRQ